MDVKNSLTSVAAMTLLQPNSSSSSGGSQLKTGFPVNGDSVSNTSPMPSSSPITATTSPGRLRRSTAINSGNRPDAKVFRPISKSMSAFIGLCSILQLPEDSATASSRVTTFRERLNQDRQRLIRETRQSIVRTNPFYVHCARQFNGHI